jgi:hypothetical protein
MAAITAIIGVVQQLHIQSLQSQVKDANKRALNSLRDHANEREVSAKLEADLKIADKDFDAMKKQYKDDIDAASELYNRWQATSDHFKKQYTDLIAMPRRKREAFIAELRGK